MSDRQGSGNGKQGISELELARQVRELNAEMQPERDLWAGIQRQILDHPQKTRGGGQQHWMPYAVAASLLVAVSALLLNVVQVQQGNVRYAGEPVLMDQIGQEYLQVRNPMVEEFARVNQGLDMRTRNELHRNLEIMSQARLDLERQIRSNPDDQRLIEMLMRVHEQELELLRQNFTDRSSSM
jgi:hypothetical protein